MGNYEELACDANVLYNAYLASIRGSKWKEPTQRFMMDFLGGIFSIQDDLCNRTYKNGLSHDFVLRERGKTRMITSIPTRDRIVRHVLCDDILLPEVRKHVIYDNGASLKGRGMAHSRKRFEVHLQHYYREYGNEGYILFGDFTKYYDNIIHDIAKQQFLDLVDNDEFVKWLLDLIFEGFELDVSYMTDEEYTHAKDILFSRLEYRQLPTDFMTGEKWLKKSVNIGDQLSQVIGVYYAHEIDNYVKYVRSMKYYGRYMDDWYIMSPDKKLLEELFADICKIADGLGIFVNLKKARIVKISGTYRYLQVKYSLTKSGKIIRRMNPKRITNMRRKLKKLAIKVSNGERTYESVEATFKSWMGAHYKLMSKLQRTNMIKLFEELFDKTVTVKEKKLIIFDTGAVSNGMG